MIIGEIVWNILLIVIQKTTILSTIQFSVEIMVLKTNFCTQ